jgi:arginyl-tRNA synthetase
MHSILELKSLLEDHIISFLEKEYGTQEIQFLNPQHKNQGDFSCSIPLRLAKQFSQNPLEIANNIATSLVNFNGIEKVEAVAPGFVNFFLSKDFLLAQLSKTQNLEFADTNQKIIVDYSSPNIAKPLGIHHILSTVIGQAAVNLLRATGNEVIAWNYLGDWGTQFGKLIYAYNTWGDKKTVEADPINELLKLYVKFHSFSEENPELDELGRAEFKKLENGDSKNRELWNWIVELSKQDLNKVYTKLGGIEFDLFSGEADREDELPTIIQEGLDQKIFTPGDKGGLIINLDEQKLIPFLVQKTDGATLYSTRDIASIKARTLDYAASKLVYVVDVAQSLHFQQLFASVKKFSWYKPETELTHLKFGRMAFKDKKMSTRKGNIIHLEELIEEATSRAKQIILEKNPELENLDQVAEIVGIGSIKYSVLSQSPETNIIFDWDKIISFDGNSAPYLQYSYARANSIIQQNPATTSDFSAIEPCEEELNLLKAISQFESVVLDAANKLKPNLLANYTFDLCQNFNSFYVKCPVLSEKDSAIRNFRLSLVTKFCSVNKQALGLLGGIQVPDKM